MYFLVTGPFCEWGDTTSDKTPLGHLHNTRQPFIYNGKSSPIVYNLRNQPGIYWKTIVN